MKDEIKEILDNPKILMLSYGNYISLDDYAKLKDYITNLQERNERTNSLLDEMLERAYFDGEYIMYDYSTSELLELKQVLQGEDKDVKDKR